MRTSALLPLAHMLATAATFTGCVASEETSSDPAVTGSPSSTPTPVATLKLTTGHVVEFYDVGGGALIVETGAAYTPLAVSSADPISAGRLSGLWSRLAPGTPVPPALTDLDHRQMISPGPAVPQIVPSSNAGRGRVAATGTARPTVLEGCNNGCCDRDWLSTFAECQGANWSEHWFNVNVIFGEAFYPGVVNFQGLICAAVGTSTFSVSIGGSGGTWDVPEATYRWYHWTAGTDFFGDPLARTLSSSVLDEQPHADCERLELD